jgi:hypothetical protein
MDFHMAAEQKELRQLTPAPVLDILQSAALARNIERAVLVNKILEKWAKEEVHRSNFLQRASRGNPMLSESAGPTTDWGELS